jgi:hypothetical protein
VRAVRRCLRNQYGSARGLVGTAVEDLAGDLPVRVAASAIVLGIFALLLAVVGPILVVSLGVEVVR